MSKFPLTYLSESINENSVLIGVRSEESLRAPQTLSRPVALGRLSMATSLNEGRTTLLLYARGNPNRQAFRRTAIVSLNPTVLVRTCDTPCFHRYHLTSYFCLKID